MRVSLVLQSLLLGLVVGSMSGSLTVDSDRHDGLGGTPSQLAVTEITRLNPVDQATFVPATQVASSADGYWTAPLIERFGWAEYSLEGDFRGLRGREGQGPGEALTVRMAVPLPDGGTVLFHDNRISVLSPAREYLHGRLAVGVPLGAFFELDGGFFAPFLSYGSEGGEVVLHRFDDQGRLIHTVPVRALDLRSPARVAFDPRGFVYLLDLYEYRIVEADSTGIVREVWSRDPDWFRDAIRLPTGEFLPRTILQSAHVSDGEIWLLFSVLRPGQEWGGFDSVAEFERRNEFMLEVIDLETRTVLFSERFDVPPYHRTTIGGRRVYRLIEDPRTGLITISIRQVSISVPHPGG